MENFSVYDNAIKIKSIDPNNQSVTLPNGEIMKGVTRVQIDLNAGQIAKATVDVCCFTEEVLAQIIQINVRKIITVENDGVKSKIEAFFEGLRFDLARNPQDYATLKNAINSTGLADSKKEYFLSLLEF